MKIQYRQFKLVVVTGILLISIFLITNLLKDSVVNRIAKAAGDIIYVSPTGLDSNPGSLNSPVKSLVKARDLSRSTKVAGITSQVNLLPGSYKMDYTLNLNSSDSNTLWKSASIGTVKIVGSSVISNNWQSLGSNLYKNNLPQITNYPRQLYVNGQKAIRSTSQNGPALNLSATSNQIFGVTGASNWSNPTDIEASGFNKSYWKHSRQKVSSVTGTTLNLNQNWTNIPNSNAWGLGFVADNITVDNAKELINEDNEWYYDRSEKALYYQSNVNPNTKSFSLPIQEKLIDIAGASNIEFNGISFEEASWERPNISGTQDYQGGVMFTSPNSSWTTSDEQVVPGHITMNNVNGVKFINNQFKNLGGAAFSCFENCVNNIIEKNSFGDIAANAITIGNHRNRYSGNNNNKFNFNTLTNVGSEYYSTVPIFVIYAGGTEIAYNTISNTPYSAISVGWGWADQDSNLSNNLINHNRITNFNQKIGDGGAIYTLSRQPGTVINDNFLDNGTSTDRGSNTLLLGLYTDEGSSDMVIKNNVVDLPYQYALYVWNSAGGSNNMRNQNINNNWFKQYPCDTKNGWGTEEPTNAPSAPTNACVLVRGVGTTYYSNNGYSGAKPAAAQLIVNNSGTGSNQSYFVANPDIVTGVVTSSSSTSSLGISTPSFIIPRLMLKVLLQGAYSTGTNTMRPQLKSKNLIPASQPYNSSPWAYMGSENINQSTLTSEAIDWILIEFHNETGQIITKKAGILKSNGEVINGDQDYLTLPTNLITGNYNLVIRHRNHLAIKTLSPIPINVISGSVNNLDLTANLNVAGNNQILLGNGKYGLKFGNVNSDNVINSVDRIRSRLSSDRINGYAIEDINMDGNLTSADRILSRLNYDSIEIV